MTAFERVKSGIPSLDEAFHNIRLGDNVVWSVSDLADFRVFMEPFVRQAIADGRNIIYVRFASHPPLLEAQPGLTIVPVELSHRFETFTLAVRRLIEKEGRGAFYVFDCLSELQTAWATDLMMGNFFKLTCPYLFELDTVAYFPVIRGRHSYQAIAKIQTTAQIFLDVYAEKRMNEPFADQNLLPGGSVSTSIESDHAQPDAGTGAASEKPRTLYVRPVKIWNRYSDTMFLLHAYDTETGNFRPVASGVEVSRFYQIMEKAGREERSHNQDSWTRFFNRAEMKYESGLDVSEECSRICNIMLTRDEKLRVMIKENFRPEDYFEIRRREIGTGLIGGKSTGMLLARKLIENKRPDIASRLEPHDSFYMGADVFYSYIVDNQLWDLRVRQRTPEGYFSLAEEFSARMLRGTFSPEMEEKFCRILDYYGQDPYIVRSSSILEDGFGNAFAGKYESVFCVNDGTMEDRLEEFERAVRTVYASATNKSALDYRLHRGLENRDEQMALLIQRVSGSRYRSFFMPAAAGVGYSVSPYAVSAGNGRKDEGMLRLVMGLGTGAVDRKLGSYPRIVQLNDPRRTSGTSDAERHRFSQQRIDVISFIDSAEESLPLSDVEAELPYFLKTKLLSHDSDAELMFANRGDRRFVWYVSCDGIVKCEPLMDDMRGILSLLETSYGNPVDTEFTINLSENGDYMIDLLQCRPLQVAKNHGAVAIPENILEDSILLESTGSSMGFSRKETLGLLIFIDPVGYYELPYREKYAVRDALSKINWALRGGKTNAMLFTPGRICTSSPELGVPSAFADISEMRAIAEVAETKAGYQPELSFGSHIFQDLVEAEIFYTAVFANERTRIWRPEKLRTFPDVTEKFLPELPEGLQNVISVYDVSEGACTLWYDMVKQRLVLAAEKA